MALADVYRIVADYNDFVALWNSHKLNPPPSRCTVPHPPLSALWWTDARTERWCIIRVDGWRHWESSDPWARRPIDIERVVWAGWLT